MKSLSQNVITESIRIGTDTSKVAEAAQTDLAYKFVEIMVDHPKTPADKAIDEMKVKTNKLLSDVLSGYPAVADDVGKVAGELFKNSTAQAKTLYKIDNNDEVKGYLYKITGDQLLANQKVTYKNGRKIGFKEYTEMATRTRIQHDMLEQQREIGIETRQLFYICDTYSDCANDHQDYQGQLYYDEKVWAKVPKSNKFYDDLKKGVDKCKASITEVTENKPWLTTRPNCRHRLIAIAIDDVVHLSKNEILKVNDAYKGSYSKSELQKNYADTQKQRAIELGLRKAKRNQEIWEKVYKRTKDPDYLKGINIEKRNIRIGQNNMRRLTASNGNLKRDYRRENPYHLQKDLGVAYNTTPVRATFKVPDIELNDETNLKKFKKQGIEFVKSLPDKEQKAIDVYMGASYRYMNMSMYDPEVFDEKIKSFHSDDYGNLSKKALVSAKKMAKEIRESVEDLHKIFEKNVGAKVDKPIIVYRGGQNVIGSKDTTIIFNGFTSTTNNKATVEDFKYNYGKDITYKIIIPPEAQDQAIHVGGEEDEQL